MEQGEVEVLFCDLCGSSVPAVDIAEGVAVRHNASLVGKCCLPALRAAPAAAGAAAATAVPTPARPRAGGGESRGALLAVLVVAVAAAGALFLDQRLTELGGRLDALRDAQKSDSEVLAGMAVALDGMPRRGDLDAIAAALAAAAGKHDELRAEVQKRGDDLAAAVAAGASREGAPDYRPLFEDLRQRQLRMLEQLAARPAAAAAAEPSPPAALPASPAAGAGGEAQPAAPAAAPAGPAVPAALAEAARKLASADPAVRFEGVDEIIRSKDAGAPPLLLPMVRDADPFVRRLVVEGLAGCKRADVVEALLGGLGDADEYVRDTAWRSLKEVTGQKFPFESGGGKDARARAVARWQDWWEKNKAAFPNG